MTATMKTTDDLAYRLKIRTISACECGTKTTTHRHHELNCLYRILMEALEVVEPEFFVRVSNSLD